MSESKRGRPKGSRNKLTNAAKEAIQMAFDELGGVERLVEWVKEDKKNEFVFYARIYPMLLPRPAPEPPPEAEPPVVVPGVLVWQRPDDYEDPAAKEEEPCPPPADPTDPADRTDPAAATPPPAEDATLAPPEVRAAGPPG